MSPTPLRGDVWWVDLDPTKGHEQAGQRPALILSADALNRSPAGLVVVLPITSKERRLRSRVRLEPPAGGLAVPSFVICEQPRTVSTTRLRGERCGFVPNETMLDVERCVRWLLGL